MKKEGQSKTKAVIIVLSVLLALCLFALAGTFILNKLYSGSNTVFVPDNIITPDTTLPENTPASVTEDSSGTALTAASSNNSTGSSDSEIEAASIVLYSENPRENEAFAVSNMFPGDSVTKYFRVRVAFHGRVSVHFSSSVRPGYEKLAEALKAKVTLVSTGETLYDGLIADMPKALSHSLSSYEKTTEDLYYEITAYLDTSVGNEYQNRGLIADFKWWVEETDSLDDLPFTGDTFRTSLYAAAVLFSGTLLLILLVKRKKEDETND